MPKDDVKMSVSIFIVLISFIVLLICDIKVDPGSKVVHSVMLQPLLPCTYQQIWHHPCSLKFSFINFDLIKFV